MMIEFLLRAIVWWFILFGPNPPKDHRQEMAELQPRVRELEDER